MSFHFAREEIEQAKCHGELCGENRQVRRLRRPIVMKVLLGGAREWARTVALLEALNLANARPPSLRLEKTLLAQIGLNKIRG